MNLNNEFLESSPEVCSPESAFKVEKPIYYMSKKYEISKKFIETEYFRNNKSQQEIADWLGVSQWVISQRMKEFNFKSKDRTWKIHKRKYFVDDNFFDEINGQNAWVLGWLASDGFVIENGNSLSFGIKISEKDSDIIHKIKELLKFNGKIHPIKAKLKKTGKEYKQLQLKITSKKIVKRLEQFGIVKNKTNKLSFPKMISELGDEEITKAFIRGFFEGDGSVLFYERLKSPCFQIVGTKELLEGIQSQLMKYLPLKKTKLTRNTKKSNHFALRYRGRFQAMKIFNWLYLNQTDYLNRKYYQYLKIKRRLDKCEA